MRKFHAHVAQSAKTDHANLLIFGDTPVPHRRVSSDSGAEQGSNSGKTEVRGNAQDKPLVDDDAVGVAAIGDASQMLVREVVGQGEIWTELLETRLALGAGTVRVHHAADCGEVARLEL